MYYKTNARRAPKHVICHGFVHLLDITQSTDVAKHGHRARTVVGGQGPTARYYASQRANSFHRPRWAHMFMIVEVEVIA
jgi:hypothetical protein